MSTRVGNVTILACLCCFAAIPAAAQEPAEPASEMLQSALYKQEVEGDLRGAIELYSAIAEDHAEARPVAARALLRLGRAYETLGSREAERAYGDLVREYPEQSAAVEHARQRLDILRPDDAAAPNGPADRRLWQTWGDWVFPGAVSPDGREVAFVQWTNLVPGSGNSGDLAVADVRTGEFRVAGRTSPYPGGDGDDTYVSGAVWSPDGDRLAYSEWATTWDHHVLKIVNADGTERRVVSDNIQNKEIRPKAMSSDGRWIVALIRGWDDVDRIATVSIEDGSVTVLKTLRTLIRWADRSQMTLSLSPDDRFIAYSYSASAEAEPEIRVLAVDGSRENVVAPNPATDLNPVWTPDGSRLVFLSDRSGTADLWAVEMADGRAADEAHVVRPHVGPIAPLGFTAEGALSYVSDVPQTDLRIATLPENGPVGPGEPLTERFVGYNRAPAWSPDGSRVAYLSRRRGAGLEPDTMRYADTRNYLVVKSLADGTERDIELPMPPIDGTRPAWSVDGEHVLLNAWHVETPTSREAGYTIDLETGEVRRAPYLWDAAGRWSWSTSNGRRFVSGRQSERLRSLGLRIARKDGEDAIFVERGEPLRPGESLLSVRRGIGWLRQVECDPDEAYPNATCVAEGWLRETVVNYPEEFPQVRGWALSPDGSRLAYLLPDADGWNVWVHSVTLDGSPTLLHSHAHSETTGCGCTIRWTPDGRHLVYGFGPSADEDAQLYRIDTQGSEPERLEWAINIGALTFGPDGQRAIFPAGDESRTEVWTLSNFPWDQDDAGHE